MILHYLNENFHIQQHDLELEPFQPRHKNIIINVTDNENKKIDYSPIASQLTPLEHLLLENRLNIFCIIKANFSECNRIIKLETSKNETIDFLFEDFQGTPIPEVNKQVIFENITKSELYEYTTNEQGIVSLNIQNIDDNDKIKVYTKSENLNYKYLLTDTYSLTFQNIKIIVTQMKEPNVKMLLTDTYNTVS